jgi:hypothetical protein
MVKTKSNVVTGPRVLPVIQVGPVRYYADLRLGQFRETDNPHHYIEFNSKQGQLMCRQNGILQCPACRMSVIVSKMYENQPLRCMQCLRLMDPLIDE